MKINNLAEISPLLNMKKIVERANEFYQKTTKSTDDLLKYRTIHNKIENGIELTVTEAIYIRLALGLIVEQYNTPITE